MKTKVLVAGVIAASFVFGFFTHRQRWYVPVEAAVAWATGESGGCGLFETLRAPFRRWVFESNLASVNSQLTQAENGITQYDTPLGSFWTRSSGTALNFAVAEQLSNVYTMPPMQLGPGDVVLDCGAANGTFVRLSLLAGVDKVIAIEPSPRNVESLNRTFAEEIASGRVIVVAKGVWHEDAVLPMYIYENDLLDSFVMTERQESAEGPQLLVELPLTTIDQIVADLGLDHVTFIKMDIEGAERNAIQGAAETISKFRPRMSLATENLEDDYLAVPAEVAKIDSNYDIECGFCRKTGQFSFRPGILYFTPQ